MLLSRGAEADTSAGNLKTALSPATYTELRDIFDSLLQHGASLDASGGFFQSSLAAAILGGHSKMDKDIKGNLSVVNVLLDSGEHSAITTADESDIIAALKLEHSYFNEEDRPHIIKMMFDRSNRLTTTEEMLKAVRVPRDLDVLLAHTSLEEGLVTPAVMSAMAACRAKNTSDMLRMLHDYGNTTMGVSGLRRWSFVDDSKENGEL
ncbi:Hypothetical protein PENO1_100830 [Penicillium occitanis (nom. inval.)]|nr:Hypothetical protein PENO1_100830 [Penicillium occitanis (nom. inval.)]PCG96833.1 hypothetical protein PENOC_070830 [Penicillium occitanis (nom. inval.)]